MPWPYGQVVFVHVFLYIKCIMPVNVFVCNRICIFIHTHYILCIVYKFNYVYIFNFHTIFSRIHAKNSKLTCVLCGVPCVLLCAHKAIFSNAKDKYAQWWPSLLAALMNSTKCTQLWSSLNTVDFVCLCTIRIYQCYKYSYMRASMYTHWRIHIHTHTRAHFIDILTFLYECVFFSSRTFI